MSRSRLPLFAKLVRRDRRGSVTVEFAFIATILIATLAGVVDLMTISSMNREIERSSTQIGAMLASCTRSTDGSCITNSLTAYVARQANTLVRLPGATVSIAQVSEISGALRICGGNMTYLPSDVAASALTIMNDQDTAFVVLISTTYSTIIPGISKVFIGSSDGSATLRGWTTTVHSSKASACVVAS